MTCKLVNQLIPVFQRDDITAHYSFVNFFISPQKFGHIMLHHPLKRQGKEIQVSRLTAWPAYQEMSMKYTFK